MHYVKYFNRVDFGEVDFDESIKERILFKKVCSIIFGGYLGNGIYFNSLESLKDPEIFTVLETFLWSEEYLETVEDLIECLESFGFDPLDLNMLKNNDVVEE